MMPNPDDRPFLDDLALDRLVDGELNDRDRRALLERLDGEPDGWKRCALAFLEAQCWQESACQPDPLKPATPLPLAPAQTGSGPHILRRLPARSALAIAAGLLVAFLLGIFAARPFSSRHEFQRPVALQALPNERPDQPAPGDPRKIPEQTGQPPPRMAVVRLGGPEPATFQVPVVSAPGIDWQWLQRPPAPVPESLVRQWQSRGYEIAQRRRLVSTELPSGELVAVPIDEVELRYVGQRLY